MKEALQKYSCSKNYYMCEIRISKLQGVRHIHLLLSCICVLLIVVSMQMAEIAVHTLLTL